MSLQEELKAISSDQLLDAMRPEAAELAANPDNYQTFHDYLAKTYPNIWGFIITTSEGLGVDSQMFRDAEEKATFITGAGIAMAALCRVADLRALPTIE